MEFKIFYKVNLDPSVHKRSGNTKHFRDDRLIDKLPSYLQIEDNPDVDNEVYLIHYDEKGDDIADTLHDSIEEAMEQANWEFNVQKEDWILFHNP